MEFVLGLGLALPITTASGISVVTGVAEGVSHQHKVNAEANNQTRALKFHVRVRVAEEVNEEEALTRRGSSSKPAEPEIQNGTLVLSDDKLYIVPCASGSASDDGLFIDEQSGIFYHDPSKPQTYHPFTGFYFQYPDEDRPVTRGLVSTISRDPPVLNWIYVDKVTREVKYSNRTGSRPHIVGDWDWTAETGVQSRITLDGWEGFVAVREENTNKDLPDWSLFFDTEDDGLASLKGRDRVEVCLFRRVIEDQDVNHWGLGQQGNLGVKKDIQVRPGDKNQRQ